MRRRRIIQTIELRKAKKEDQLLKRRNVGEGDEAANVLQENNIQSTDMGPDEIFKGMSSTDETIQLKATQTCRRMLSRERNPPIDSMIRLGVVPKFVEFLTYHHK